MADLLHHRRDGEAANEESGEIGGAHEADRAGRKALLRAAKRDQRTLQPIAAEQDAGGEQQGDQGADGGQGDSRLRLSAL